MVEGGGIKWFPSRGHRNGGQNANFVKSSIKSDVRREVHISFWRGDLPLENAVNFHKNDTWIIIFVFTWDKRRFNRPGDLSTSSVLEMKFGLNTTIWESARIFSVGSWHVTSVKKKKQSRRRWLWFLNEQ